MYLRRTLAATLIVATTVTGSFGIVHATNDPFRFVYVVQSEQDYRSTLVFDDGQTTFFQFPKGRKPSHIFVRNQQDGLEPAAFDVQGPYLRVRALGDHFVVMEGKRRVATIRHQAAKATVLPVLTRSNTATAGEVTKHPTHDAKALFHFMGPLPHDTSRVPQPLVMTHPLPAPGVVTATADATPSAPIKQGPQVAAAVQTDADTRAEISELRKQIGQLQQLVNTLVASLAQERSKPVAQSQDPPSARASGYMHAAFRPDMTAAKLAYATRTTDAVDAPERVAAAASVTPTAVTLTPSSARSSAGLPDGATANDVAARSVEFVIYNDEKLSTAVRRLVEQEGFVMDWDPASGDYLVPTGFRMRDTHMGNLLARVLKHFQLSSHIRHGNKTVAISRG
jgi:hypothetical protein